jgi:hypothetical protein
MSESPPTDNLNRTLWMMGFNKEQRDKIIEYTITNAGNVWMDPADLGAAICRWNAPKFPKQKWHIRLKFWLQRTIRNAGDRIVLPRITQCRFKFEPHDLWIGVYWDVKCKEKVYYVDNHMRWAVVHFYITLLPMLPLFVEIWFPKG